MLACSVTSKMLVTEYVLRSKTEMTAASLQAVKGGTQGRGTKELGCMQGCLGQGHLGPCLFNSGARGTCFRGSPVQLHARFFTDSHNAPLSLLSLLWGPGRIATVLLMPTC